MAKIFSSERNERVSPFRGIRYNREIIKDFAEVICPPYDIITPEQQRFYYERSSYNAIRLEYPVESRQPIADNYQRAATTFQQWLKQGVLQVDEFPAFYLHDHHFTYGGERRKRRGIIACVKLEPWGNGIYPHEETFPKAKDDRLQLMRACQANFSPLFSLYQDAEQKIASILAEASQAKPIILATNKERSKLFDSDEEHIVWAITAPKSIRQISCFLSAQPIYMADGHHRYETALAYQQEICGKAAKVAPKEQKKGVIKINSNRICTEGAKLNDSLFLAKPRYVMMELVEFSDPGLVILPLHRLVHGVASSTLAGLKKQLEDFFTLEFVPLTEARSCHYGPFASRHSEQNEESHIAQDMVLGILGLDPQSLVIVKQREDMPIESMMSDDRSQVYKRLNVSILGHIILERILGFNRHRRSGALAPEEENIAYTADIDEACQQIEDGEYQLAFLLNPLQPEMVKAVADAKDRMPRKSTYFYPKLPTGLIINSLSF